MCRKRARTAYPDAGASPTCALSGLAGCFSVCTCVIVRVIYSDAEGLAEVATVDTVSSLIAWTDFCPFLFNVP